MNPEAGSRQGLFTGGERRGPGGGIPSSDGKEAATRFIQVANERVRSQESRKKALVKGNNAVRVTKGAVSGTKT